MLNPKKLSIFSRLARIFTLCQGIYRKKQKHVKYPEGPSAIKPVPRGPNVPVPEPDVDIESSPESSEDEMDADAYSATAYYI